MPRGLKDPTQAPIGRPPSSPEHISALRRLGWQTRSLWPSQPTYATEFLPLQSLSWTLKTRDRHTEARRERETRRRALTVATLVHDRYPPIPTRCRVE